MSQQMRRAFDQHAWQYIAVIRQKRFISSHVGTAIVSSVVTVLLLQPAAYATSETANLGGVVVTGTRSAQPLQSLPDNTSRLDYKTLDLLSASHPSQLFTLVPGAWVTHGSGQEQLTAIRSPLLTGSGACGAFLLLEDGVPIQPAGFCNVNALLELNFEQAGAIEVIRGPGSVLYGSNALHGIVNVLTLPVDHVPANSVTLKRGSHRYTRAEFSLAGQHGQSGVRVSANAAHDAGFRVDSGYDQQKIDMRFDYDNGAVKRETLFAATNLNQKTAGFIHGLNAYRDPVLRTSNPEQGAFRNARSLRLLQRWQFNLDSAELEVTPYVRRNSMVFTQHFIPGTPIENDAQNSLGIQTALHTHPGRASLTYGLDAEYVHGTSNEFQPDPLLTGSAMQQAIRPAGMHYNFAVDARTHAAYVQLRQQWMQRWLFQGGVRVETTDYSYVNFLPPGNTRDDGSSCGFGGCLFNRPADRSDRFTNILPKLGISYNINPTQTLYANLARGARAPEVSELYKLQRQQNVADLHSVTLNSIEVGWRGETNSISWETAAYYMIKNHDIFRDADGFMVSDGRTRHRGVEFSFRWRPAERFELITDGTYAIHTYAFDRRLSGSEVIVSGNDVDSAPRTLGSIRLRWEPTLQSYVELAWSHVGGYWLDASNRHRYGGHDLMDLRTSWQPVTGWHLNAGILNLTDNLYAARADFAFGNYRYFPGDSRTWYLEVTKDF